MADHILLEDGSSRLLLEDGTSDLLLESSGSGLSGAAALTATSTLSAAGSLTTPGVAALTGLASLTGTPSPAAPGGVSLAAVSTVGASGSLAIHGAAALASVSTLAGPGSLAAGGAAAIASVSTLLASGTISGPGGAAALAATSTLLASGSLAVPGHAALAASAVFLASGSLTAQGGASLGSVAALIAAGSSAPPPAPQTPFSLAWLWLFGGARGATPDPVGTEWHIVEDVIARVLGTGLFENAVIGYESDGNPASADLGDMVRVIPGDQTSLDDAASGDEVDVIHTGTFLVEVEIKESDPSVRHRRVSAACNAIRNVINGQSLAGITLPPRTILGKQAKAVIMYPYAKATMDGSYEYIVSGYDDFYSGE